MILLPDVLWRSVPQIFCAVQALHPTDDRRLDPLAGPACSCALPTPIADSAARILRGGNGILTRLSMRHEREHRLARSRATSQHLEFLDRILIFRQLPDRPLR
jgi:hypothetical protein